MRTNRPLLARAKGTLLLAAGLAAAWLAPAAALAVAPYDGGSGNGWAFSGEQGFFVGAGMVTLSGDQHFSSGGGSTPLSDVSFGFGNGVLPTVASNLAISIPAGFPGVFDYTVTSVTASGPAAARISGAVAYANGNRTALIGLASNTVDGDQLTLSGLSVSVFSGSTPVPYYLTADTNADGTADLTDTAAIFVDAVAQSRSGDAASVYGGGTKDGWDWVANAAASVSGPNGTGTAVSVAAGSSWWNDDGFGGNPPVADWEFDDHAGGTVADKSGGGNNGTWHGTGTVHWAQGKVGSAGNFNGSDDYVRVQDSSLLKFSTMEFSVSAWVKTSVAPQAGDWRDILTKGNGYRLQFTPTRNLRIYTSDNSSVIKSFTTAGTYNDGKWHYVTAVSTAGSNLQMYVDGILSGGSGSQSSGSINDANDLIIGATTAGAGEWLPGSIDGVRIYNYARSPAQVADDYNRGAPVGWWKLNECTGTTLHDGSGNGFTGTLNLGASGQTSAGTCTASANTAWYNGASGKFNASLNFDGTDDYVDLGSSSLFGFTGTAPFAITGWFNATSVTGDIVGKYNKNVAADYKIYFTGGKLTFEREVGPNYDLAGNTTIQTGQWYFFAAVYDGTNKYLYLNGAPDAAPQASGSRTATSTNLYIGAQQTSGAASNFFPGKIDDVRVYNYALSQSQVEKVMNYGGSLTVDPGSGQP